MAKSSRKGPGSAKHLASSSSPERLTNSDAGMIAQAPCVQQPINGPLTHHSRSPVQRLPAPLPLNTPKPEKSLRSLLKANLDGLAPLRRAVLKSRAYVRASRAGL